MDQITQWISDVILAAAALGAGAYCLVLARRLKRFNTLENGVGGAVAVLSAQVDDMTRTLDQARKAATHSSQTLTALTERAEDAARKLELMMASLHDLPDGEGPGAQPNPAPEARLDKEWNATANPGNEGDDNAAPKFATRRSIRSGEAA